MVDVETALKAAVRSGALIRYMVRDLEPGEFEIRRLWIRPDIDDLLNSSDLDKNQLQVVRAAFRRFVIGGKFTVVTAACSHQEVESLGDIRELKGEPPPFIELRFKPPKHDLRLLGRFVIEDGLVLTTHGMKSLKGNTGQKKLSVKDSRGRCDAAFRAAGLQITWVPSKIENSLTKANFI